MATEPLAADGQSPEESGRTGSRRRIVAIVAAVVVAAALAATVVVVVQRVTEPPGAAKDPSTAAEHWLHDLGDRDVDAACSMTWGFGAARPPLQKGQPAFDRCVAKLDAYVRRTPAATLRKLQQMTVRRPLVKRDFAVVNYADISPELGPRDGAAPATELVVVVVKYRGLWYATDFGL